MPFQDHFSGHATSYRAARPTYPDELFDWLTGQAPDRSLAWDVGCGNGQASLALAKRFERVIATDPSAEQIAQAEPAANIEYRIEPAETSSLADRSVSLVCIAQALHWFDLPRFYEEVRRVSKPGGIVAAWAYGDCRVAPEVDEVTRHLYADIVGTYWPPERAHIETGYRGLMFPFEKMEAPELRMIVNWSVERFLAYLRSWSASQRYGKATGVDPVGIVERDIREAWGEPTTAREVEWGFVLLVGRVGAALHTR